MNKKREALRHGLRSFIEDTSRELEDLEGRAPRPRPAPPAPAGGTAPTNGAGGDPAPGPSATAVGGPAPIPPAPIAPPKPRPVPAPPSTPEPRPAPLRPPAVPRPLPVPKAVPARAPRGRAPKRRTPARPLLPERVSPDGEEDGIDAAQAHARKGVCFAYFLNQACWRVPEAYCNRALQVCITRECPVYHLHKDALERRFAKKFQHFW